MVQTIEQKTSSTILQQPIGSVTIGGKQYDIPAPTTATLIMVSGLISTLPEIDTDTPKDEFIPAILGVAKDANSLGQIAAVFILGAKRIKEYPITDITTYTTQRKWSWRRFRKIEDIVKVKTPVFEQDYIAEQIMQSMTPKELHEFIANLISEAHLADFFVLTTSLHAKSITKPTREVVETTACGASSGAGLNIGN